MVPPPATVASTIPPITTIPPTTTTTAPPATVSYTFAPDTPAEDQAAIRQGIDAARNYALRNYGPLKASVRVMVQTGTDPTRASGTARASNNDILVFTGAPGWLQNSTPLDHSKVLAHELFHVIQFQFHRRPVAQIEPAWLFEGSAEQFAWSVIVEEGLTDAATAATVVGFTGWRSVRGIRPPNELETREQWLANGGKQTYALATACVDVLLDNHGGVDALKSYFDRFRPGVAVDWSTAFEQSFGISPAGFYAEITRLRV